MNLKIYLSLIITIVFISGCNDSLAQPPTPTTPPVEATEIVQQIETETVTATLQPTNTASPSPTMTSPALPTATTAPTESPTSTPSPTLTPTPTHPLMIPVMRQQNYPGSDLIIEETLEPGDNYDRFVVSYLSEGYKIYALLTIPQGESPETGWPVIIFNHGYIPPAQYRTTERYVAYVDGFARNGYVVFRSDYRGHGFSEGEATGGYGSPAYTVDVLNGMTSVQQYPGVDPERVGMWGHSMGGHITLRSMVVTDTIKVGVVWAGVVVSYPDLLTRWRRNPNQPTPTPNPNSQRGRWRYEIMETYGSPEENPTFWNAVSANSYLTDLSGPIQIHHGTADSSVPVEFATILHEELQTVGQPNELYIYEGDNHNLSLSFNLAMERSLAYFDRILKPGQANSLESAESIEPFVFSGDEVINLRDGPDTSYEVIGGLGANQTLPIIGRNVDSSWWQVETINGPAWVAAWVVTANNIADVPLVAELP